MKDIRDTYIHIALKTVVLIIILGCVSFSTSSVCALEIIMKDHAIVDDDSVYVRDIAHISGDDETLIRMISDVYICKAPNPGYEREINKAYLIMKLKHNNCDTATLRLSGSTYTKVSVHEYIVSSEQQKSALTAWVSGKLDMTEDEFNISYRKEPRDIVVNAQDINILFKGKKETFMGRNVGVYMELYANDKLLKRSAFNFSVELLKHVVVPIHVIHKDDVIKPDDVRLAKKYVAAYQNDYFIDIEAVVGGVAQRDLSAAEHVTIKDIRARMIIKRGETVDCTLKDKNMNLRLTMQSREDGAKGEIIRLINPVTEKTVRGIVIGESQVELML